MLFHILLDISVDPPHFVVRPLAFYQKQPGQTVTMWCEADGQPAPKISWRKVSIDSCARHLKDKYPNFEVELKCILMVFPYLLLRSYINENAM